MADRLGNGLAELMDVEIASSFREAQAFIVATVMRCYQCRNATIHVLELRGEDLQPSAGCVIIEWVIWITNAY